jgi:hypothetical protein
MGNRKMVEHKSKADIMIDEYNNKYNDLIAQMYHQSKNNDDEIDFTSEEYKAYRDTVRGKISMIDNTGIRNITKYSADTTILSGSKFDKFTGNAPYGEPVGIADKYKSMMHGFFDELNKSVASRTKSKSTGSELINKTLSLTNLNYNFTTVKNSATYGSVKNAYENFKNAKEFMSFDLETLGGKNVNGYNTIDAITEFSFDVFNKAAGSISDKESINNVIGFSKSQYDDIMKEIADIETNNMHTGRLSVMANRLGKYGHIDTELDTTIENGRVKGIIKKFVGDDAENLTSVENLKRGAKRLRDLGVKQEADKVGGLMYHEEQLQKVFNMINSGSMFTTGHNINRADIPWLKQMAASQYKHLTPNQDGVLNFNKDMTLDTISVFNMWGEHNNKNSIYKDQMELLKNNTAFQLEPLGKRYFPGFANGEMSHVGNFDSRMTAMLLASNTEAGEAPVIDQLMSNLSVNYGTSGKQTTLKGGNAQLFLARQGNNFNDYNTTAGLNFVYDPASKKIRTLNGYEIDPSTGSVEKLDKNFPIGIKKNRTYSIDYITKAEMSDQWVDMMKGMNEANSMMPEFAQKDLVFMKLNPVYNNKLAKGMHTELDSPIVMAFQTQEAAESYMSTFLHIADKEKGEWTDRKLDSEYKAKLKDMMTPMNINLGTAEEVSDAWSYSIDNVIDYGTKLSMNDASARLMREESFTKTHKFNELHDAVSAFAKKNDVSLDDVKSYIVNNYYGGGNTDRKLSEIIASGQPLTLYLQDTLGFTKHVGDATQQKLFTQTINKTFFAFDAMADEKPITDAIMNYIKNDPTLSTKNGQEKDFIFKRLYDSVKNDVVSNLSMDKATAEKVVGNYAEKPFIFKMDSNYFEFGLPDNFFKHTNLVDDEMFDTASRTMRLDFGKNKEFSLLDKLFTNKHGLHPAASFKKEGAQGFDMLGKFMKTLNADKSYKGLFSDLLDGDKFIKDYEGVGASALSNEVYQRLKQYSIDNGGTNYVNELKIHEVINGSNYGKTVRALPGYLDGTRKNNINTALASAAKDLPSYRVMSNNTDVDDATNYLMDRMLAVTQSLNPKDLQKHGFSENEAHAAARNYESARSSYKEWVNSYLKGLKGTNVSLIHNSKSNTLELMQNGVSKSLDSIPKLVFENGHAYIQSGNQRTVLSAVLNIATKEEEAFKSSDLKMSTSMGSAIKNSINPFYSFKKAELKGNALNESISIVQNLVKSITEFSTSDKNNLAEIQASFNVDVNSVINKLPELEKGGVFKNFTPRDEQFYTIMKDYMSGKKRADGFADIPSQVREAMGKNLMPLLQRLSGMATSDEDIQFFLSKISPLVNETKLSDGVVTVGNFNTHAMNQFNNQRRPPVTQGAKMVQYNAKDWEEAASKINAEKVLSREITSERFNPIVHNAKTLAQYNKTLAGNTKAVSGIRGRYLTISEKAYKDMIIDEFNSGSFSGTEEEQKKILNKLKSTNLFEQEAVMNARLGDTFWNEVDSQRIKVKKDLLIEHEYNIETIENLKNMTNVLPKIEIGPDGKIGFTYEKGFFANKGSTLVHTRAEGGGIGSSIAAKYDGFFKFAFETKENHIRVGENEIRSEAQKLFDSGFKTPDEIFKELSNRFDGSFQLHRATNGSYTKLMLGGPEKGMYYGPIFNLGEYDKELNSALKGTKHEKWLGRGVSENLLEMIGSDTEVLERLGLTSTDAFIKRGLNERYAANDELFKIINRGRSSKDAIDFIANHGLAKHESVGLAVEGTLGLLKDKMSPSEYANIAKQVISNATVLPDGTLMLNNELKGGEDYIDLNPLKAIAEKHGIGYSVKDKKGNDVLYLGEKFTHNGKLVGAVQEAFHYQTTDFIAGTSANDYMPYIQSQIDKVQRQYDLKKISRDEYRRQMANVKEKQRNAEFLQKGLKVTDRGLSILESPKYDDTVVNKLRETLSDDEFKQVMGDTVSLNKDGSYSIREDVRGKALLGDVTADMRDRALKGNSITAKEMYDNDPEAFKHIKGYVDVKNHPELEGLSLEKAEDLHSFAQGARAVAFNNSPNGDIKSLKGFSDPINIRDVEVAKGDSAQTALKMKNNLYTNDLLVDLGDDIGLTKSERFLAMNGTKTKMYGDNLIKRQYQKDFETLTYYRDQIDLAKSGDAAAQYSVNDAIEKYKAQAVKLKEHQALDVTGKTSIFKDAMSGRLATTFTGETSSLVLSRPDGYEKLAAGERVKALQQANGEALSKMTYKGKGVLEHYAEGKVFDVMTVSKQAIEDMGLLSDKVVNANVWLDKESIKGLNRKQLLEKKRGVWESKLQTEGLPGILVRYPETRTGSDVPVLAFYDPNLSENRMQILASTQKAMGGDNDSDKQQFGMFLDDTGKVMHRDSLERGMMYRAVGQNTEFDKDLQATYKDEVMKALNNSDAISVAKNRAIDGKVYAEHGMIPSFDQLQQYMKTSKDVEDYAMSKMQENNLNIDKDLDRYHGFAMDFIRESGDKSETYRKAFAQSEAYRLYEEAITAKNKKLTIGAINTPLFKAKKLGNVIYDGQFENTSTKRNILEEVGDILEQGVIGSKHGKDRFDVDKTQSLIDALNGAMFSQNERERKSSTGKLDNWLKTYADGDLIERAKKLSAGNTDIARDLGAVFKDGEETTFSRSKEEISEYMRSQFTSAVEGLNTKQTNAIRYMYNLGESQSGVKGAKIVDALLDIANSDTLQQKNLRLAQIGDGLDLKQVTRDMLSNKKDDFTKHLELVDGREWLKKEGGTRQEVANVIKFVGDKIHDVTKDLSGKQIAVGALGIAGAYMVAGFVGGNPAAPAQNQAEQNAEDQYYTVPNLQDGQPMVAPGGQQQGYVININARTGRGKEHAEDAIRNAMSQSIPTDINISMNINDNHGNISDRYIENLIAGAI